MCTNIVIYSEILNTEIYKDIKNGKPVTGKNSEVELVIIGDQMHKPSDLCTFIQACLVNFTILKDR